MLCYQVMKLIQLVDIVTGNTLRKCFELFGGLGPSFKPFSIYQLVKYFLNNQSMINFWFFTALKV